jgi:NAD(P)-dependent dehydrogenase (short-subunit alcohol dehydrogenase family)
MLATIVARNFRELPAETFEQFWRADATGFSSAGMRQGARCALGRGTVIFTGASASLRGRPGLAHFVAAKAGLSAVAQSMAREYGPQGIHVAHVVIVGGIAGVRLLRRNPHLLDERDEDGLLGIEAIAEAFWQIHRQACSAWTHEIDLRPFKEPF